MLRITNCDWVTQFGFTLMKTNNKLSNLNPTFSRIYLWSSIIDVDLWGQRTGFHDILDVLLILLTSFLKTHLWLRTPEYHNFELNLKKTKLPPCYGCLGLRMNPRQDRNPASGPELGHLLYNFQNEI